jgi:hypothetical protein
MVRVGRPSPLLTVGVAVTAVVLVVLVATGDTVPLATEGSGGWRVGLRDVSSNSLPPTTVSPAAEQFDTSHVPGEGALSVMAQTVVILIGAIALLLVGRALLRMARGSFEPLDLGPVEQWPAPAQEMAEAVDEGLAALVSGPVDDVVIDCWVRLEAAAAAAGAARDVAETPAELASRVLEDLHAPQDAVDDLLDRYRQARYSHHPLDEHDREVALHALRRIRDALAGAAA